MERMWHHDRTLWCCHSQPKWWCFDCKTLEIAYSLISHISWWTAHCISTQKNMFWSRATNSTLCSWFVCLFIQLFEDLSYHIIRYTSYNFSPSQKYQIHPSIPSINQSISQSLAWVNTKWHTQSWIINILMVHSRGKKKNHVHFVNFPLLLLLLHHSLPFEVPQKCKKVAKGNFWSS